ncbi:F0F1 ATP synthase subunit gamma, partial [Rickettsiales bacterium]|nr:F0F1 ATP synthase subunit gamma [Rickettsiales bacterium]
MIKTFQQMRHKINGAEQLESVVRTMKAQAAANITQYEIAVKSLEDYCRTIELGLTACFRHSKTIATQTTQAPKNIVAIVFGSDQGLVGQFNDQLTDYVKTQLEPLSGAKKILAVGGRIGGHLSEAGFAPDKTFAVPSMITMFTALIGQIITESVSGSIDIENTKMLIFYNSSTSGIIYKPTHQQLLPLDAVWQDSLAHAAWPTANLPEIINEDVKPTLRALIREHLFISLFRACAESLASENASRLMAMQRAEKNIDGLLEELKQTSRSLRQST